MNIAIFFHEKHINSNLLSGLHLFLDALMEQLWSNQPSNRGAYDFQLDHLGVAAMRGAGKFNCLAGFCKKLLTASAAVASSTVLLGLFGPPLRNRDSLRSGSSIFG